MTRARKKVANPGMYTGKTYLTYDESTDFLGISLSTLARYVSDEGIETLKFHRDKKRYLKIEDVKRIEDLIKNPWKRTVPQQETQPSGAGAIANKSASEEKPWYLPEKEESTQSEEKSESDAA